MAVVTIIDSGNTIEVTKDTFTYYINKRDVTLVANNTKEELIFFEDDAQRVTVLYSDVTNPVEATFGDLVTTVQGMLDTVAGGAPLPAGAATEAKQDSIITYIDGIARTTGFLSAAGAGSVSSGAYSVSVLNNGNAAGTLKGVSLPKGVGVTFKGDLNDTMDAIAYDATGTTFLITEVR